jgi:hypothetical protein
LIVFNIVLGLFENMVKQERVIVDNALSRQEVTEGLFYCSAKSFLQGKAACVCRTLFQHGTQAGGNKRFVQSLTLA